VESIEAGVSRLVPLQRGRIAAAAGAGLAAARARTARPAPQHSLRLYGDGYAAVRCACHIARLAGVTASLEALACGSDSIGGSEFVYEDALPLLDRHVIRDGDEEERRAVLAMETFPLSVHPSRLFRPYYTPGRISVILTQYKRNTTELQLRHLFRQTVFSKIDRIVIFQNEEYVDLKFLKKIDFSREVIEEETTVNRKHLSRNCRKSPRAMNDIIEIVHSPQYNYKYHGRFAVALMFDSEYTIVLDDDTIPQPRWLEVSTEMSGRMNAIVGPVGVIVGRDRQFYLNPPMDFMMEVNDTIIIIYICNSIYILQKIKVYILIYLYTCILHYIYIFYLLG
jgi:hypothetical protein